jgi:hypothetical protein
MAYNRIIAKMARAKNAEAIMATGFQFRQNTFLIFGPSFIVKAASNEYFML